MTFFFFNDTATTEIYTLSLHDALPILFSVLSALGARAEAGRLQMPALRAVGGVVKGGVAKLVGGVGGLLGLFIAGYTGILLSVTNRPIWADSPWLGALFVASGGSTGAATRSEEHTSE